MRRLLALALLPLAIAACRTGRNYADAPRHAGAPAALPSPRARPDTLRIVTYNIAFARMVDDAIALLRADARLRDADLLLLQEMDADATRRVAEALGMWWVYYPAIHHRRSHRDFGNAVLSRWPIVEDARVVLPHVSRYAGTQRTATAATVDVAGTRVRVYSTHLGTVADVGDRARREQLATIVADAERWPMAVIAGDMNDADAGRAARDAGWAWPTEQNPRSTRVGRWDHVFLKGLAVPAGRATGVADAPDGISDHRPVWARALMP